jgi:hypothetical protein
MDTSSLISSHLEMFNKSYKAKTETRTPGVGTSGRRPGRGLLGHGLGGVALAAEDARRPCSRMRWSTRPSPISSRLIDREDRLRLASGATSSSSSGPSHWASKGRAALAALCRRGRCDWRRECRDRRRDRRDLGP